MTEDSLKQTREALLRRGYEKYGFIPFETSNDTQREILRSFPSDDTSMSTLTKRDGDRYTLTLSGLLHWIYEIEHSELEHKEIILNYTYAMLEAALDDGYMIEVIPCGGA